MRGSLGASRPNASRPKLTRVSWGALAFTGALLVYAVTRFWRLGEYPIYFFTDEAFQVIAAADLLRDGLRDARGALLPLFFLNGSTWAPYLPVYFHALAVKLLGTSPEVARGTAALVTLFGAGALGLAFKVGAGARLWWAPTLFLAVTPAWFLHSRTAFETTTSVAFGAGFLLCYVLYRRGGRRDGWFLYPALLCLAGAFYSYLAGPTVVFAAGLIFLFDLPYLLRQRRHVLGAIVLAAFLAVPLIRYTRSQPAGVADRVASYASYWLRPLPLSEKLRRYATTYVYGLSPTYWFAADPPDLSRHEMRGYGHLWRPALPLIALGIAVCLRRIRRPVERAFLLAGLAAPFAAAVTEIGITRVLFFVVPAALYAAVGLETVIGWLPRGRLRAAGATLAYVCLSAASPVLLYDALTNGPLWYRDYGLYGQQWGATQLFRAIPAYLAAHPEREVLVSSNWANGTDLFVRFFVDPRSPLAGRVRIGNVGDYTGQRRPLTPSTVLVMTPEDLEEARGSGKFATVQVDDVLPYPDGRPGFFFVRLTYVPNLDDILAAEREARQALIDDEIVIDGERVAVRHSLLDSGSPREIVDGDARSLARFMEANPAIVELRFPRPRRIGRIDLLLASGNWKVTARLSASADDPPEAAQVVSIAEGSPDRDAQVELIVPATPEAPPAVGFVRLEIQLLDGGNPPKIHLRELRLLPP